VGILSIKAMEIPSSAQEQHRAEEYPGGDQQPFFSAHHTAKIRTAGRFRRAVHLELPAKTNYFAL
jgi:hypothetical protein